jgi:YVTN family beta-propeller protein
MKRRSRIIRGTVTLAIVIAISYFFFIRWGRAHVNYMTATEDHPIDCFTCHLYIQKDNLFAKLVNKEYYSPYKLTISATGDRLYVVAQEANTLLVVDPVQKRVVNRIKVGLHPHSVVLDDNRKVGFVSNQWADNVFVIDLATSNITDTLVTGNGPSGLALSKDKRYLYVVNSFSNNVSIFDLQTKEEIKRLDAGNNPASIVISPDGGTACVTSRRGLISPYGSPLETELTVINTGNMTVSEHRNIESAYIMENIAFTPSVIWL